MDFTSIGAVNNLTDYTAAWEKKTGTAEKNTAFETLFQSALEMVNKTNDSINEAREAELSYAMGLTNSTTDVQVEGKCLSAVYGCRSECSTGCL